MEPVRTAIIGCGKVGQIHAQALCTLPESKFVAVCDAQFARAQSFAGRYGVEAFDSLPRMLSRSGADVQLRDRAGLAREWWIEPDGRWLSLVELQDAEWQRDDHGGGLEAAAAVAPVDHLGAVG